MKEQQVEKSKQMAELANLEKEKLDRQMELEERRLALEARRLAKEERVDESRLLAEEERILNIDLDTCKPSLRVFYRLSKTRSLPSTRRHLLNFKNVLCALRHLFPCCNVELFV